jgi:hypothetical protein
MNPPPSTVLPRPAVGGLSAPVVTSRDRFYIRSLPVGRLTDRPRPLGSLTKLQMQKG